MSSVRMNVFVFGLQLCAIAFSFTHIDARRSTRFRSSRSPKNLIVSKHLDFYNAQKDDVSSSYGVGSPFTIPPYDSLPPVSWPDQITPPFCIDSPFMPLPPPAAGGSTGGGYTPLPPPSSSSNPNPPMGPGGPITGPSPSNPGTGSNPSNPGTGSNPSNPGTGSGPSTPNPNPPVIYPGPPTQTPSPSGPITNPSPSNPGIGSNPSNPGIGSSPSNPNPPIIYPGPPSLTPSPTEPILSPPTIVIPRPPSSNQPPSIFQPTPPVFQPPVVYPPPAVPPPPRAAHNGALWCVAKPTVPDPIIQEAMNYACGSGGDCGSIQPQGLCFQPDTLYAHSSYAFNSYWQRTKVAGGTCDFGGTAMLVTVDPSYDGCHFVLF